MVTCPECDSAIDVEEEEIDEGETLSCTECGKDLRVVGVNPLELEAADDDEEEEEEDGYVDDEDEEEEDEEEDWK